MKKRWISVILALVLLSGLAACGSGGGNSGADKNGATASADNGAGWAEDATAEQESAADFGAVRQNAKLILRADLSLETQTFEQTTAELEKMTAAAGGYIESSGAYGAKGARSADYTVRVPQEKFEDFLKQVGEACHIVSRHTSQEDVSEQYTDIETRLATLQTKHERLLALLDQAGKMEDIISLENALADCEYEIDSLTGEKRHYDSLVGFSTISLYVSEVQSLTAVSEGTGFGAQLAHAAKSGLGGLTAFARGAVLLVVTLWPVLIVLAIVLAVLLRVRKRRREKRTENQAEGPKE